MDSLKSLLYMHVFRWPGGNRQSLNRRPKQGFRPRSLFLGNSTDHKNPISDLVSVSRQLWLLCALCSLCELHIISHMLCYYLTSLHNHSNTARTLFLWEPGQMWWGHREFSWQFQGLTWTLASLDHNKYTQKQHLQFHSFKIPKNHNFPRFDPH